MNLSGGFVAIARNKTLAIGYECRRKKKVALKQTDLKKMSCLNFGKGQILVLFIYYVI